MPRWSSARWGQMRVRERHWPHPRGRRHRPPPKRPDPLFCLRILRGKIWRPRTKAGLALLGLRATKSSNNPLAASSPAGNPGVSRRGARVFATSDGRGTSRLNPGSASVKSSRRRWNASRLRDARPCNRRHRILATCGSWTRPRVRREQDQERPGLRSWSAIAREDPQANDSSLRIARIPSDEVIRAVVLRASSRRRGQRVHSLRARGCGVRRTSNVQLNHAAPLGEVIPRRSMLLPSGILTARSSGRSRILRDMRPTNGRRVSGGITGDAPGGGTRQGPFPAMCRTSCARRSRPCWDGPVSLRA